MKSVMARMLLALGGALLVVQGIHGMRLEAAEPELQDVFVSQTNGYHTYRIPSLICTPKGTLLAFCEGRKFNGIDQSPTNLVLRRSLDRGRTWQPMQVVVNALPEAAMNPTAVFDRLTDSVVLVYSLYPEYITDTWPDDYKRATGLGRDSITLWVTTSNDEGVSWSTPVDITAMIKKPEWSQVGIGPGVGIQTRSGRLVIPTFFTSPGSENGWMNTAIQSDDHGKTWRLSESHIPNGSEPQMVELADGALQLNIRGSPCRKGATSKDGGKTWSKMFEVRELVDPDCQGSILRYTWADQDGKSRVLFCNPGVPWDEVTRGRHTGTVRLSYDEGKTWPVAKVINQHKSFFGYSCLTAMPDGTIGVLFEGNGCARSALPSKGIEAEKYHVTFARFSLEWVTDGKDSMKH